MKSIVQYCEHAPPSGRPLAVNSLHFLCPLQNHLMDLMKLCFEGSTCRLYHF